MEAKDVVMDTSEGKLFPQGTFQATIVLAVMLDRIGEELGLEWVDKGRSSDGPRYVYQKREDAEQGKK